MVAVIGSTDGIPVDVVVFNTAEEAQAFRARLGKAIGVVWDRVDIRQVTAQNDALDYAKSELARD